MACAVKIIVSTNQKYNIRMLNIYKILSTYLKSRINNASTIYARSLFTSKKKKKVDKFNSNLYLIKAACPPNYEEILRLFWNAFVPAEPLFIAAGLSTRFNPVINKIISEAVAEGYSLVAKCRQSGEIVGAAINTTMCPWDPDYMDRFAETVLCENTAQLLHFYAYISRIPDLWCTYCQTKIFETSYLMTKKNVTGQGIGDKLLGESIIYCRDMGYRVYRVDATSEFSSRICIKQGLQKVWELPYTEYVNKRGKPFYSPPPPHHNVRVYVGFPLQICPE